MATPRETLIELETKFWQSMVDQDADVALEMLNEPALMVSAHGAMKFDHDAYRKMAEQGSEVLTSFELSNMDVVFPNDKTAILTYRVKQGVAPRGKPARFRAGDERLLYLDSYGPGVEVRHAHRNRGRIG